MRIHNFFEDAMMQAYVHERLKARAEREGTTVKTLLEREERSRQRCIARQRRGTVQE